MKAERADKGFMNEGITVVARSPMVILWSC